MVTIRGLLLDHGCDFFDDQLSWGAHASVYFDRIQCTLKSNRIPVLVELDARDLFLGDSVIIVDHHGHAAGADHPCSLEQVFQLLDLPKESWTRHFDLVAANDKGHIRRMRALRPPATDSEISDIRQQDRQAQGVTPEETTQAQIDVSQTTTVLNGTLTISQTNLHRTGLIAEYLDPFYGGPGFQNLLIRGPKTYSFYGNGNLVKLLASRSPVDDQNWWYGGELPSYGFWGGVITALDFDPVSICTEFLGRSS